MSYDNDNILSTGFHHFDGFIKDLEVRSANDFIKGLLYNETYIKCIGFVQTCFQSQTYSFEVAQEHIETLQRK